MMQNATMLLAWLVGAMLRWVPPTAPEVERYEAIALDAAIVAFDPDELPIYKGASGRARTAALLLSIASYESSFSEKVERGEVRGDGGRSWCMMQVNLGSSRIVLDDRGGYRRSKIEGWTGSDLAADRRKCFAAALRIARESFRICGDLSLYTTGRCWPGESTALERRRRAESTFRDLPAPDADLALGLLKR